MKLHSLEIQAFGPFAKTEIIDFDALGHNPLFLIDGPTGAGKSSILHAICYALYGETTDSDRKELGLRCDHADNDLLTQLSLEFSIRDDRYRITRIPTQLRPAKKGEGLTEQKASAELSQVLNDGSQKTLVPKKVNDAKTQIHTIVGLTAEQFRQVMVLPQGKFRDLLLAKSDDRQAILSTLFQTDIYKQIEQRLKDQAAEIERKNAGFEKSKQEALVDVSVDDVDALIQAISQANDACIATDKAKQSAHQALQTANTQLKSAESLIKDFSRLEQTQSKVSQWQQQSDPMQVMKQVIDKAEKATRIAPVWQTLDKINKDIIAKQSDIKQADIQANQIEQQLIKVQAEFEQAEKDQQQRDGLKAQHVELSGYKDTLKTLAQFEKTAKETQHHYDQMLKQHTDKKQQLEGLVKQGNEHDLSIETLTKQLSNKAEWVAKKLGVQQQLENRKRLDVAQSECDKLIVNQQQRKQALEITRTKYSHKRKQVKQLELLFHSQQAAFLAAELDADNACPVCGSFDHPTLAQLPENAPTQAEVEAEKEALIQLEQIGSQAKSDADVADNSVASKQAEIKQLQADLGDAANQTQAALSEQLNTIQQQLNTIETQETQLTQVKQQLSMTHEQQSALETELKQLDASLPPHNAAAVKANSEFNAAQSKLPEHYRQLSAVDKAIAACEQHIKQVEQAFQSASNAKTDTLQQQSAIQAALKTLQSNLDALTGAQQQQQSEWQQALLDSAFNEQQAFEAAVMTQQDLQTAKDEAKRYDETGQTLKAELDVLTQQVEGKHAPDIASLQTALATSEQHYQHQEADWNNAEKYKAKLDDVRNKLQGIEQQQGQIKADYEVIGTLAKAASGKGNVRVSLERFVLGNLLDSVLSIASQRLHIMSKGQYRLIRQNESDQKRNQTAGLDLAIDDAHTGKTRPVATLSGGESFMASLALALGLSDVVQERTGGIQLDTLFIDEGFGSLDQESLQLAINTLIDLQSTGRTIGIISHVSELKEQMAQRIEVVGTREGSRVRMVS